MTTGSISRLLLAFALPLLLGNLFQQLYNTVDSLVVGNFVGTEALAAVGSTTSIINTLVSFFNGVSIGAGVIISQYYGAHDNNRLHLAIETTMTITIICSVILTVLGYAMVPLMLRLMSTPEDVLSEASVYLRIYFSGISGLLVYNMGSGILRAVGDTKRPLMFLCFSSILNMGLDLLFVLGFHLGIAGVGYATIISQFLSAILILLLLSRSSDVYHLSWNDLKIEKNILKRILIVGLPTGLQQALTSFSNVFVQSYINSFGSSCMAGWSCYTKIDQFIMLPLRSMGQAATTFVSQNIGARNISRARRGTFTALAIASLITFAGASMLWIFAPQMVYLFNQEQMVVYYGVLFLRLCVFFMLFSCVNQVLSGALRGIGNAKVPMIIMLSSFVAFRQLYLFTATRISNTASVVGFGYPAGWIVSSMLMTCYYLFSKWEKKLEVSQQ
ncbi:MAG: MATE family efflux transporter [Hungatella sp.]|nr:MATE family efflux transporter [Hungatella sp.]